MNDTYITLQDKNQQEITLCLNFFLVVTQVSINIFQF